MQFNRWEATEEACHGPPMVRFAYRKSLQEILWGGRDDKAERPISAITTETKPFAQVLLQTNLVGSLPKLGWEVKVVAKKWPKRGLKGSQLKSGCGSVVVPGATPGSCHG